MEVEVHVHYIPGLGVCSPEPRLSKHMAAAAACLVQGGFFGVLGEWIDVVSGISFWRLEDWSANGRSQSCRGQSDLTQRGGKKKKSHWRQQLGKLPTFPKHSDPRRAGTIWKNGSRLVGFH